VTFFRSSVRSVREKATTPSFGSAHHSLAPPVLNDRFRGFDAGPVEAMEGARRELPVEHGPVGGKLDLEVIEHGR